MGAQGGRAALVACLVWWDLGMRLPGGGWQAAQAVRQDNASQPQHDGFPAVNSSGQQLPAGGSKAGSSSSGDGSSIRQDCQQPLLQLA